MDFTFSESQSRWREAAADFARNCAPPADDTGTDWLKHAVASSREAGLFDCARVGESGAIGVDLLALCLMAEELARLDTGFCIAFLNRSLCYLASALFLPDDVRQSFSDTLGAMSVPLGAVLIWPDARGAASGTSVSLAESQLQIDEIVSLSQPDTTHCLGWGLDPESNRAIGYLASGNSIAASIEASAVDGFRTLPLNRLTGLVYCDGGADRIHRSQTFDFAGPLAAAGAKRDLLFAAAAIGLAQAAVDYALDYSRGRMSFDKPLFQHQAVALRLADAGIRVESARLLLWAACGDGPEKPPDPREAAQCGNYCARVAADAASWASQLLGGHGFLTDHPLASWLRDIHLVRLLGGHSLAMETNLS